MKKITESKEEVKHALAIQNEDRRKKSIKEAKRLLSLAKLPAEWKDGPKQLFKMAASAG